MRPSLDAFCPFGLISRARPVTSKSNPLINISLKKMQLCTCRTTETSTDNVLHCLKGGLTKCNAITLVVSVMALQIQGARLYMQHLICFFRSVCKLISQWTCRQNQPICQLALLSNAIRHQLKSQCFCKCIVAFF